MRFRFLLFLVLLSLHVYGQFNEVLKLLPPAYPNNIDNNFGYRIAIDGDYAVVSAPGYWGTSGKAIVLHFNGTSWEAIATLKPSMPREDIRFGQSVAIDGDVIAIGAMSDNGSRGLVYLFLKPESGDWTDATESAILYPSTSFAGDHFGYSVAIEDSVIVVGTDSYGARANPVYIYIRPADGWTTMSETYQITASDQQAADYFGYSVDIKNGIVAVGAPLKTQDTVEYVGAVYIYDFRNGFSSTTETAKISYPLDLERAHFGCDVAVGDSAVVIGALLAKDTGRAFVYKPNSDDWSNPQLVATLRPNNTGYNSYFGASVSIDQNQIVVGAYRSRLSGQESGNVYVFETANSWSDMVQTATLSIDNPHWGDYLGFDVAINNSRILAGAPLRTVSIFREGQVFYYSRPSSGWTDALPDQIIGLQPEQANHYDQFGAAVAMYGNIMAVGAPGYHYNKGCVFVYQYDGSNWNLIAQLRPSDTTGSNTFGQTIVMNENTIVVGAPSAGYYGKVFVFEKSGAQWQDATESAVLYASNYTTVQDFGSALDIFGDTIAVGAYNSYNFGKVYLFVKPSDGWSGIVNEVAELYGGDYDVSYHGDFGFSVKLAENKLFVGVPEDLLNPYNSGTVRVFTKQPGQSWADLTHTAVLITNDQVPDQYLGASMDYRNGVLVVGANYDRYRNGAAYIFIEPSDGWSDTVQADLKLASDLTDNYDYLGDRVLITDQQIFVASRYYNSGNGGVFVYQKGSDWTDVSFDTVLISGDLQFHRYFGSDLAANDQLLAVGAKGDTEHGYYAGAVYIYSTVEVTNNENRITDNHLAVFPNPVADYLFIQLQEPASVQILDISGKTVVYNAHWQPFKPIDVRRLKSGIYLVKVRAKDGVYLAKFIKQ